MTGSEKPEGEGYYFASPSDGGRRRIVQVIEQPIGFASTHYVQAIGTDAQQGVADYSDYVPALDPLARDGDA